MGTGSLALEVGRSGFRFPTHKKLHSYHTQTAHVKSLFQVVNIFLPVSAECTCRFDGLTEVASSSVSDGFIQRKILFRKWAPRAYAAVSLPVGLYTASTWADRVENNINNTNADVSQTQQAMHIARVTGFVFGVTVGPVSYSVTAMQQAVTPDNTTVVSERLESPQVARIIEKSKSAYHAQLAAQSPSNPS